MLRVGIGVVRHGNVALRPQRGDLVGQRRLVMRARRAQHPGGGSRLRQWVQDLGGGGRPDAGGGGTRPTRRSVAPESVDDGSRRYTHLRAASTSVHSASGVGDAMSPASRDGMCAEANASAAFLTSFSFTIRRRDDSSYPIRRSGRFALRRLNTARHITRYLATFTPSLPPRASRPVSPPAPPSTPGRRA